MEINEDHPDENRHSNLFHSKRVNYYHLHLSETQRQAGKSKRFLVEQEGRP